MAGLLSGPIFVPINYAYPLEINKEMAELSLDICSVFMSDTHHDVVEDLTSAMIPNSLPVALSIIALPSCSPNSLPVVL